MQQGRGGIGSRKHGVSGHASQSPRFRLMKKLAAERGELGDAPQSRPPQTAALPLDQRRPRRRPQTPPLLTRRSDRIISLRV